MKVLSDTWFADGYIDFELKKYTLLAYLQEVNSYFDARKLYPQLSDIIFHYNNLVTFRENKKFLQDQFPKTLTGVQKQNLQLLYQQMMDDDDMMLQLEEIIHYATGQMRVTIGNGTELYEEVEDKLTISPVGIIPLEQNEGYFFLSRPVSDTHVYQYRLSIYESQNQKFRSIRTEFVNTWCRSLTNTFENIKTELIRYRADLPNPATYAIEVNMHLPVEETLLPVAKRSLVRYISGKA